jgi:hypothetical protein
MVLVFTQPLTEMNIRNNSGGKAWPARKTDNLAAICERTVTRTYGPPRPVTKDSFTCFYLHMYI